MAIDNCITIFTTSYSVITIETLIKSKTFLADYTFMPVRISSDYFELNRYFSLAHQCKLNLKCSKYRPVYNEKIMKKSIPSYFLR